MGMGAEKSMADVENSTLTGSLVLQLRREEGKEGKERKGERRRFLVTFQLKSP